MQRDRRSDLRQPRRGSQFQGAATCLLSAALVHTLLELDRGVKRGAVGREPGEERVGGGHGQYTDGVS